MNSQIFVLGMVIVKKLRDNLDVAVNLSFQKKINLGIETRIFTNKLVFFEVLIYPLWNLYLDEYSFVLTINRYSDG